MKKLNLTITFLFVIIQVLLSQDIPLKIMETGNAITFPLVANQKAASVWVDTADYEAAKIAASLFTEDVERVSNIKPFLSNRTEIKNDMVVFIGTLEKSYIIDLLVKEKKIRCCRYSKSMGIVYYYNP